MRRLKSSGRQIIAAFEKRARLRGTMEHHGAARAHAQAQLFGLARALHDFERVIEQALFHFDVRDSFLHRENVCGIHHRRDRFHRRRARVVANDFFFAFAIRVAHADAHQETVELRFRQRIGAVMLDRILRGEHQERLRQRMRVIVHRDLRFVHRFEQRGLRFRRGAVDFVGDDDVREDRSGLEFEALRRGVVDADADHVARQQVRGELDALERAVEGARERLRERCLAHAGNVFDQQVAAREQSGERELDYVFLAFHDARNRAQKLGESFAGGVGIVGRSWLIAIRVAFCYKK